MDGGGCSFAPCLRRIAFTEGGLGFCPTSGREHNLIRRMSQGFPAFGAGPSCGLVGILFPLRSIVAQSPQGSRAFRRFLTSFSSWVVGPLGFHLCARMPPARRLSAGWIWLE
jgi:hypothetical protein